MAEIGRVMAAVDLEGGSEPILGFASNLARAAGSELIVLHVISPEEQEERAHNPGESRFVDVMIRDAERTLQEIVDASGAGDQEVRCVARVGEPVDEILKIADETDCTIVIGMRRRSRVGKFLLGSDLQEILLATSRPIVTVPIEGGGV